MTTEYIGIQWQVGGGAEARAESRKIVDSFKTVGATAQHESGIITAALDKVDKATSKSAAETVRATMKRQEALKAEIASYRAVAEAAEQGSRTQVVALEHAQRAEEKLARTMRATSNAATKAASDSESSARRTESAFSGLGTHIGRYSARAVVGIGAVGAAVGTLATISGLSFYKTKQSAEIAFETMLGSGAKAKAFLGELAAFARDTPFEFPELIHASQQLLNVGFEAQNVIPILTSVGDAVAAAGGSPEVMDSTIRAIGQVQAKGRLMAEEMMQLNEAGTFSWKALADAIGVSVPQAMDLVSKGAVDADMFLAAFQRNSEQRFGGMMEKQSHTIAGLWSTLKDTFGQTAATALEPVFKMLEHGMQRVATETAKPEFTAGVERFAHWVGREAVPAVMNLGRWVVAHRGEIAHPFEVGAHAVGWFVGLVRDLWGPIMRVKQALDLATGITGIKMLIQHWGDLKTFFAGFWRWLEVTALRAALRVTEAMGHLPSKLGKPFRDASKDIRHQLDLIAADEFIERIEKRGKRAGDAFAEAFAASLNPAFDAVAALGGTDTGAAPGSKLKPSVPGRVGKAGASGRVFPFLAGSGAHPVISDIAGHHTRPFGNWQSDDALDIAAEPGTWVLAVAPGVVSKVNLRNVEKHTGGVFGAQVTIDGDDGTRWFYTHIRMVTVKVGDHVAAGDPIGVVTKWAAGRSHLHIGSSDSGRSAALLGSGAVPVAKKPGAKTPTKKPDSPKSTTLPPLSPVTLDATKAKDKGLIVKGLDAEQQRNARLIWDLAHAQGFSDDEAIELIAIAYAESKLRTNAKGQPLTAAQAKGAGVPAGTRAKGLFQLVSPKYTDRAKALQAEGYSAAHANVLAILPTYDDYWKTHPNAAPGAAGRDVEGSGEGAGFYSAGIGSKFRLGAGGYTGGRHTPGTSSSGADAALERVTWARSLSAGIAAARAQMRGVLAIDVFSPEDEQKLADQFVRFRLVLGRALKDGLISPAEKAKIEAARTEFTTTLTEGLNLRGAVLGFQKDLRGALKDHWITDAEYQTLKDEFGKLKGPIADGLRVAWSSVDAAHADFDRAWSRLERLALRTIEKGRKKLRDAITYSVDFGGGPVQLGGGGDHADETPTERLIREHDEARAARQRQTDLDEALASGDQQRIDDARWTIWLADHQRQLEAEQAARDEARDDAYADFDAQTEDIKSQFQDRLNAIKANLASGVITQRKALDETKALFAEYKLPTEGAANELANAMESAIVAAVDRLTAALEKLATLLDGTAAKATKKAGEIAQAGHDVEGAGSGWARDRAPHTGPGSEWASATVDPAHTVGAAPITVDPRSTAIGAGVGGPQLESLQLNITPTVNVTVQGSLLDADDVAAQVAGPLVQHIVEPIRSEFSRIVIRNRGFDAADTGGLFT